ncbi:MAG: amino acid adenylation domain-containing protein [Thermoanaerobaculia bacterium]
MPESVRREEIAIVGMAGHFPGARDVEAFWKNLRDGVESVSFFTAEDLAGCGVDPAVLKNPSYVPAGAVLEEADSFDAAFFGYTPREAELMDPQHRRFLEGAWEAIESAGYDPATFAGPIGVFCGVARNTYLLHNLAPRRDLVEAVGVYPLIIGNDKDFPATRVSFKLDLRGPSLNVQTACSTSGVAVHLACQSLLAGECDMALAGGARIQVPLRAGYLHQEGGILSPDGRCRAFDARARGTVLGSGVALIVLRRLSDALRAGDHIHAVLKATAINNDGSAKVGFTAPSVEGQAAVIAEAHAMAEITADSIGYVEAHGTGTAIGDPIEIAALTKAFRRTTAAKGFCAIGSVKTNIGHLDAGAGVTGIIKTALSLTHGQIPPSLHFKTPNPEIDFANSPFFVNASLRKWPAGSTPRRAGVSSFGLGGTNFHAVLEEAPPSGASPSARPWGLLVLSARTDSALEMATGNLAAHLGAHPELPLGNVAYTLQTGRRAFDHRRIVACRDTADAAAALSARDPKRVFTEAFDRRERPVVFLFPGQGSQHVGMGKELYRTELLFRNEIDRSAEILRPLLGFDLLEALYPGQADAEAEKRLTETSVTQPALFAFEHALARLWMSWGIRPEAMLGHSVGEYVAACLAGVFTVEDGLHLIARRASLMQELPAGAMLAVRMPEEEIGRILPGGLSIAAVNAPSLTVVSGPLDAVAAFEERLAGDGVASRRLHTSHAFHSEMVEPVLDPIRKLFEGVQLSEPRIPYISNLTGTWIAASEAVSPNYWARHLRHTVRFSAGVGELLRGPERILLEAGPGQALSALSRQSSGKSSKPRVVSSLPSAAGEGSDAASMLTALGRLWMAGASPDWRALTPGEQPRRVPLPTYPFERKKFWIEPRPAETRRPADAAASPFRDEVVVPQYEPDVVRSAMPRVIRETAPNRRERVLDQLKSVLHELSGIPPDELDPAATFLECGFDSLFLTQAAAAFQNKCGLPITFRQLFEATPSLETLAAYVDENLPAEAAAQTPPPPTESLSAAPAFGGPPEVPPRAASSPAGDLSGAAGLQKLMAQQLQVMAGLLEMMSGGVAGGQAIPAVAAVGPPSPSPAPPAAPAPEARPGPSKPAGSFGPWRPIQKEAASAFTPRQQKHLDSLVARFNARTPESKRLAQANRAGLADPRTVSGFRLSMKEMVYPIVVDRAAGSKLWDVDGNEWIDITMGFGVYLFGHSPEFITAALARQLGKSIAIGPQTALAGRVAEMIREFTGLERVAFCNTGSEAVLAALRVCRTVTGRSRIALFAGDYHGIFDEVLVKGIIVNGVRRSVPVAPGIPSRMVEDVMVLDYGDPESLSAVQAHAKQLAAVLVEPVQGRRPDFLPGDFLRALRDVTKKAGIPMIMDEMITGFRSHPRGAQGYFGVEADLATYGKVIGGGMPIGVVAGKAAYMDALDGGAWRYGDASVPEAGVTWFAGTFVRHPLTLAAAEAALTHLKEKGPRLQEELNEKTTRMAGELNAFFAREGAPFRISHFSSLFVVVVEGDPELASLLWHHLRMKGIHTHEGRPNFLTTAHSEEDIAAIVRAFQESVAAMRGGGFLPEGPQSVASDESRVPPTPSQEELLRASRSGDEASCALNLSYSFDLKGPLDVDALRGAVRALVSRHDALRMTFGPKRDSLTFAPALEIELPVTDFSGADAAARERSVAKVLNEEVTTPFDLARGPLMRARLLRLEGARYLLLLTVHHTACDAFSGGTIVRDLSCLYNLARRGSGDGLPAAMQFSDYARSKKEGEKDSKFAAAHAYWLRQCAGPLPVLELPLDRPRPARRTYSSARIITRLPRPLVAELKASSARQHCSLFSILLSGFSLLLHRLSGQDDVIVGIPASGQSIVGRQDLVGHCVNFHPFRSRLKGIETVAAYLKSAQATVLDAYEHRDFTYGSLAKDLDLTWDGERPPLFSVQFHMDPGPLRSEFDGLETVVSFNARRFYLYELGLNVVEADGELILRCEFNTDLFDPKSVDRFLDELRGIYQSLAAGDSGALPSLLPRAESGESARTEAAPAKPGASRFPLTEGQKEIWVGTQIHEKASRAYNDCQALHLRGPLRVSDLEQAVQAVVDRHDALRTTFSADGEFQQVAPRLPAALAFSDLSGLGDAERETRKKSLLTELAETPFDLVGGPLTRFHLIRLGEEHHALAVAVHHLICDGYSLGVLFGELGEIYSRSSRGESEKLPDAMQYREYAEWFIRQEKGPEGARAEQYWREEFATLPPILELPVDRPRPAAKTYAGTDFEISVDETLLKALQRAGAKQGCTLFMTLAAGLSLLLHRLSGEEEVVVGIPAAGQNLVGGKNLVGHCVNFLPLRSGASLGMTVSEFLKVTRQTLLDAYDHQNYTLGSLIQKLSLPRDSSRLSLVNVSFNLDKDAAGPLFQGLEVSIERNPPRFVKFDLAVNFIEAKGSLRLQCQYNTDLLEDSTVRRWMGHLLEILRGFAANSACALWDLPLLTETERRQILIEWNETSAPYPREKGVHELFEEHARRAPEAVALLSEGEALTYSELDRRSNRLARYLVKRGVRSGSLVGICLERSPQMVVALLGVLKAGGAYVPLDPAYPKERLRFMLEDTGLAILLTEERLREYLPDGAAEMISLESDGAAIGRESEEKLERRAAGEDLAYVMYTSGSTGVPKGVEVPHRAIVRLLHGINYVRLDASETLLHLSPISFDASTFEIWGALTHGARCVLFTERIPTPQALRSVIEKQNVSTLWLTASLFNTVIDADAEALSGVRQLLIGGEALSAAHVRRALERLPSTQIINGYGPTESTTFTCCYPIPKNLDSVLLSIPIGRPISNTRVYLLDSNFHPVPIGVAGELFIGGDGLARGYCNRAEATAEKFLANPLSESLDSRLYRTGDLARWKTDGTIEFHGRTDDQVKIRGFRIEPAEIEAALRRHPAVEECAVVPREDAPGGKRLVAYVVGAHGEAPAADTLRVFLKEKLPEYMVPSRFVALEAFPRTPSGKLDRRSLPEPDLSVEEGSYSAPRDSLELQIVQAWEDLLQRHPVGLSDNFFDLGGHSLLAVRLFVRIEKLTGRKLPLATLFQAPTVGQLASILREEGWTPPWSALVAIQPGGSKPPLFCVHAVGGNVLTYRDLSRRLGPDQPVYGLQAVGLDGRQPPYTTVEDMAAHYVREVRTLQPRGPYHLAGASSGGTLAYEMARQLVADGEEAGLLGLFDTFGPGHSRTTDAEPEWLLKLSAWRARIDLHVGNFFAAPAPEKYRYVKEKSRRLKRRIRARLRKGRLPTTFQKVELSTRRALGTYVPQPYPGKITMFRASKQPIFFPADPTLGWQRVALGGVEVHEVPGHHGAIVYEPRVRFLAEKVRYCLDLAASASQ